MTFILTVITVLSLKFGVMTNAAETSPIADVTNPKIFASASLADNSVIQVKSRKNVTITAYSSRPEETDSTPFIAASGKRVHDGMVAANWLPMGTKVRIPALFGDKIFVVEDRMHARNAEKLDIWFASTDAARNFGVKIATVEIL